MFAVLVVLALAGCGGDGPAPQAWAADVCEALEPLAGPRSTASPGHPAADDRADHPGAGQGESGPAARRGRAGQRGRPGAGRAGRGARRGRRRARSPNGFVGSLAARPRRLRQGQARRSRAWTPTRRSTTGSARRSRRSTRSTTPARWTPASSTHRSWRAPSTRSRSVADAAAAFAVRRRGPRTRRRETSRACSPGRARWCGWAARPGCRWWSTPPGGCTCWSPSSPGAGWRRAGPRPRSRVTWACVPLIPRRLALARGRVVARCGEAPAARFLPRRATTAAMGGSGRCAGRLPAIPCDWVPTTRGSGTRSAPRSPRSACPPRCSAHAPAAPPTG